jgi:GT2 family glycosyltransferase
VPFVLGIPRCNPPPTIFHETLKALQASTLAPVRKIIVDNGDEPLGRDARFDVTRFDVIRPSTNVGCAAAWNMILYRAFIELAVPTAILINDDCAVAPDTFERMLASERGVVCAQSFSCFRIDVAVWDQIGPFDEAFYPAYWEDTDYRRRLALAGVSIDEWPYDVVSTALGRTTYSSGITHGKYQEGSYQGWTGAKLAWFHECLEKNRLRYVAKWGGMPGAETYTTPFRT